MEDCTPIFEDQIFSKGLKPQAQLQASLSTTTVFRNLPQETPTTTAQPWDLSHFPSTPTPKNLTSRCEADPGANGKEGAIPLRFRGLSSHIFVSTSTEGAPKKTLKPRNHQQFTGEQCSKKKRLLVLPKNVTGFSYYPSF